MTLDPTIGVLIAAVLGPLGAYLLAARRFSGKIGTSDATDLWAESRSIREWSQTRIETLDTEISRLRLRVELVERQNDVLARENSLLLAKVSRLDEELELSRRRILEFGKEADGGAT